MKNPVSDVWRSGFFAGLVAAGIINVLGVLVFLAVTR